MTIVIAAILGLIFGSFVNALVFRTHADIPMMDRSMCIKCEIPISWYDLVPVLSFILLRGRCRRCKKSISWQYPLVEAAMAICFALIAWDVGDFLLYPNQFSWFLRGAILTIFLVIIFVYDQKYGYILDTFSIPAIIIAFAMNVALGFDIVSMLIGAVTIGGFFLAQYLVSKGKWIGGGDIRMGVLMGVILGLSQGLLALFLAYFLGAMIGSVLLISGRAKLGAHIPFGTFLAVGTFVAMLWGEELIGWYLGYFL